jgi:hypothetical protein
MKRSVLSTFMAGLGVLGFAFAGVASGGCQASASVGTPAAESPGAAATPTATTAPGTPTAPPPAPLPPNPSTPPAAPTATATAQTTAGACTKNDDCHTQSFYCDSCQCLGLGIGQKEPKCTGKPVQCLVDPCLKQKATCDHGKCVVGTQM